MAGAMGGAIHCLVPVCACVCVVSVLKKKKVSHWIRLSYEVCDRLRGYNHRSGLGPSLPLMASLLLDCFHKLHLY